MALGSRLIADLFVSKVFLKHEVFPSVSYVQLPCMPLLLQPRCFDFPHPGVQPSIPLRSPPLPLHDSFDITFVTSLILVGRADTPPRVA